MKIFISIVIFGILGLNAFGQVDLVNELKTSYDSENYDQIISKHYEKANEYPAKAVYYIGMAFYMKEDDSKVLELMDLSIKKDNSDPDAYFIKGMTLNYLGQFEKAIDPFTNAIKLDSTNSNYYSGLGDSYISTGQYENALTQYISSTEKIEPIDRPFTMIPQIYAELNQPQKALASFYNAKDVISKESPSYIMVLYNIGLYELLNKEYGKSELALKELIELAPNDYHSYAKLIQVYYGKKEYSKAKHLKEKLYKAYNGGLLKDEMKEMFCFDQFDWNNKLVQVFERFAVEEGELYYKHIFYIVNDEGEIEFRIQTENSPISVELGGPKYILGMDKDGTHSTFRYGFEEDFDYDKLKEAVILVLEEKIEAGASSRPSKGN